MVPQPMSRTQMTVTFCEIRTQTADDSSLLCFTVSPVSKTLVTPTCFLIGFFNFVRTKNGLVFLKTAWAFRQQINAISGLVFLEHPNQSSCTSVRAKHKELGGGEDNHNIVRTEKHLT